MNKNDLRLLIREMVQKTLSENIEGEFDIFPWKKPESFEVGELASYTDVSGAYTKVGKIKTKKKVKERGYVFTLYTLEGITGEYMADELRKANSINEEELTKTSLDSKEIQDFLYKVKQENPDQLGRFRSLVINRGLDLTKAKYKEIDPDTIKQKKLELSKEKRKETRQKWYEKNKERLADYRIKRKKDMEDEEDEMNKELMYVIGEPRRQKEYVREFVAFIPNDFPKKVKKAMEQYNTGFDSAYYMLTGAYQAKFENQTHKKIDFFNEDVQELFEELMYEKFGDSIEF